MNKLGILLGVTAFATVIGGAMAQQPNPATTDVNNDKNGWRQAIKEMQGDIRSIQLRGQIIEITVDNGGNPGCGFLGAYEVLNPRNHAPSLFNGHRLCRFVDIKN